MMRRIASILFFFALCMPAVHAADVVDVVIDTNYVKKAKLINDYSMIGVQYGVALSSVSFDPSRNTKSQFEPVNVGVMYTRYGKLFGYMPYFGFQIGAFYTRESYQFETLKNGATDYILGARHATLQTIEVPFLAHLHFDFWKMKVMVNVGPFLGYRLNVTRSDYVSSLYDRFKQYEFSFHPNEKRFDYGIKAGGGLGFVFDPIEIHITAAYKYSLSNLHQPDVNARTMEHDENSKYYYKWSYPTNIIIGVGLHYQLTKRSGYTRKELRQQAKEEVDRIYQEALKTVSEPYDTQLTDSQSR